VIRRFTSTVAGPAERGEEFGSRYAAEVAATVHVYRRVFASAGPVDLDALGTAALRRIEEFAPGLAEEVRGIARGAGVPVSHLAAVNARTEVLAMVARAAGTAGPSECSTVVSLGDDEAEPVAVQTWDWYPELAGNWLEWTIPHPDGRRVVTVTEAGIVGKIGINGYGVGLLFNILHHRDDGVGIGVPVHVVARHILDTAPNVHSALQAVASARVSASTAITLVGARRAGRTAVSAELWPGGPGHALPTPEGLLVHTNHFLSEPARLGDLSPVDAPDTLVRYEVLRRRLHRYAGCAGADQILAVMADHTGGLCCHPDPVAGPGPSYATLATVRLDLATTTVVTHAGGPCTLPTRWRSPG
jgi:isopenicillin-N N-acyltransferase-like protein